jgi:hypothetical protein
MYKLTAYQKNILEAVEKLNRNESFFLKKVYVGTPADIPFIRLELSETIGDIEPSEIESQTKQLTIEGYLCNCTYDGQRSFFISQKGAQSIGRKWSTS